eukprot:CAMPEP_0115448418 /NCGR_PEP_ID=MMETSP0271-20121206/40478_1 /TAXON_ID=71861 /ORGANISM="Scrippsiella trochoidea, Strain CCMP3099" /LENGTH=72 /DNA_ID=CAMNT_0002874533 /DNA_START=29 /DNA_END=247 /DNA_ORIENTATION=-
MTAKASPMFFCKESNAWRRYIVLMVFTVKESATKHVMPSQCAKNPSCWTCGSMLLINNEAIAQVVARPEILA